VVVVLLHCLVGQYHLGLHRLLENHYHLLLGYHRLGCHHLLVFVGLDLDQKSEKITPFGVKI